MGGIRRWFSTAVCALAVLAGAAPDVDAAVSHHWADRSIVVRNEAGPIYEEALRISIARWSRSGTNLQLVYAEGLGRGCGEVRAGEVLVCGAHLPPDTVGTARIHPDGHGHIVAGIVELDLRAMTRDQRISAACHELGHAIGLEHREQQTTCMFRQVGPTSPDAADYERLRALYGHQDARPCHSMVRINNRGLGCG